MAGDRARRVRLDRLLGGWRVTFPAPRVLGQQRRGGAVVQDLRFDAEGAEIPAWLALPDSGPGPFPVALYCHAHGNDHSLGRDELLLGRGALQGPWLHELARLGIAALALDLPTFGQRQEPQEIPLSKALHWQGRTLFGRMLAEYRAAIRWLAADPRFDRTRIGAMGLSMGATHAFWLGALEPRLACILHFCCFADLGQLVESGAHDLHGPYMTVPGLLRHETTGALAGLAAPVPQFVGVGLADPLTPPAAFATARGELEAAYKAAGAAERLAFHVEPEGGHRETAAMRAAAVAFLTRHLAG